MATDEDEKKFAVLMGFTGVLGTAAGIAAIPLPEHSEEKCRICPKLFDIFMFILLGSTVILGIGIQCKKDKDMRIARCSFSYLFIILVICFILKMVLVVRGDFGST